MYGYKTFLCLGDLSKGFTPAILTDDDYELLKHQISFGQGTDKKGKVQSDVLGGIITLSIMNIPSVDLLTWGLKHRTLNSGAIVVCSTDDKPIHRIEFTNARCIGFKFNYSQTGSGYCIVQLTISAEHIVYAGIEYDPAWI